MHFYKHVAFVCMCNVYNGNCDSFAKIQFDVSGERDLDMWVVNKKLTFTKYELNLLIHH